MNKNLVTCPICNNLLSKHGLTLHMRAHSNRKLTNLEKCLSRYSIDHDGLNCKYCGKLCKNKNSLCNHEIRCSSNPCRINISPMIYKGRKAWNKGLSKETYPKLAHTAASIEKMKKSKIGYRHSQADIKRMKENPRIGGLRKGSGRGKKGTYKGYYCDSTYELIWTIYCLDHNISFKRCRKAYNYEYKGQLHKYHPDYELVDGSIVEIKGYHTEVVDLKIASVKDVPIKILYRADIEYMFDYVKNNYSYNDITDLYDNG